MSRMLLKLSLPGPSAGRGAFLIAGYYGNLSARMLFVGLQLGI